MTPASPKKYYYEFSPVLILELRHVFTENNMDELGVKAAFAAWQRAIDEEIKDAAFHDFVIEQLSPIMAAIARGEDDVMLVRDISGEIFLRIAGKEVEVPWPVAQRQPNNVGSRQRTTGGGPCQ